ncbi:MAG: putative O-glycosylation ligase, exosortase A system-associated [Alphaproteobacteria bacterium]
MRDIALTLFVLGGLIPAIKWPWIGATMFAWLSIMNPHRLTWSFAQNQPFAALVAACTLFGWIISREPKRFPLMPLSALVLVFAAWVSLTTVLAISPADAMIYWKRTMKIFLMVAITMTLITDEKRLRVVIWVVVMSLSFFGIKGGLFTANTGGGGIVLGPFGSYIAENNALALALTMCVPLVRYLQVVEKRHWIRWALIAAQALMVLSIVGSFSRGAFLAISVMLFALFVRSRQKLLVGLLGIGFVFVIVPFMPAAWHERMSSIQDYEQDASAQGRFMAWNFAYRLALDRPLVGGGFNVNENVPLFFHYVPDADRVRSPHSIYFEVLGYHGFVGLLLFLAIGISLLRTCGTLIRIGKLRPEFAWARELGAMVQVSAIGYATGGAFLNLAFFDFYYYVIAIVVCARFILAKKLSDEERIRVGLPRRAFADPAPVAQPSPAARGSYGPR